MPSQVNLDDLADISLFHNLNEEQLDWLRQRLHPMSVPAGSSIITANQPGEVVYIILSGTVKIHTEQADGTDVIIALLGANDTVGEMSLLDSGGRSANVVAIEHTQLLWMDRQNFERANAEIPQLARNLNRILAGRLRMANEQIQALASLDVYGRVARQILAFADTYGRPEADGSILIPIRLTQSDIADLVGASRKRVNQVMVTYKRRGDIVVTPQGTIVVRNMDALRERCR